MDRDAVNRLLERMESKLSIRMHPHKYRHTFCTRLLKRGVELTTVAKLAGHTSIQTTASFYINTSQKDKREAVELL
jgi:site-specific recombinase XerD